MSETSQPETVPVTPNKYAQMLTDALTDPTVPEETKQEIRESQARAAAQKAGGSYVPANRYEHNATALNRSAK